MISYNDVEVDLLAPLCVSISVSVPSENDGQGVIKSEAISKRWFVVSARVGG